MYPICAPPPPPQILHYLCFSFPLGITAIPREIESNAYAIFVVVVVVVIIVFLGGGGGGAEANKLHYGRCASGVLL